MRKYIKIPITEYLTLLQIYQEYLVLYAELKLKQDIDTKPIIKIKGFGDDNNATNKIYKQKSIK